MVWWGRRKDDPPAVVKQAPKGAASEPPVFSPPPSLPLNVLPFPERNKKLSDANRAAVHALLDQLLDQIGEDEYLVMGIEGPDLAIEP